MSNATTTFTPYTVGPDGPMVTQEIHNEATRICMEQSVTDLEMRLTKDRAAMAVAVAAAYEDAAKACDAKAIDSTVDGFSEPGRWWKRGASDCAAAIRARAVRMEGK